MGALDNIIKGATTQFGREFGRAAANSVLKGANHYTVNSNSKYQGRIKPSDSEVVKRIKEVNKVKFATTNKANTSRLVELTSVIDDVIVFKGVETLRQMTDIITLVNLYNEKYQHGEALIDNDYEAEIVEFEKKKRENWEERMDAFNTQSVEFVNYNYHGWMAKRKSKSTATILAFLLGWIGGQKFYLNIWGHAFLAVLFSWTTIPFFVGIYDGIRFASWSEADFDAKFNPDFAFFSLFKTP